MLLPVRNTVVDSNGISACEMLTDAYITRFVSNVETLPLQRKTYGVVVLQNFPRVMDVDSGSEFAFFSEKTCGLETVCLLFCVKQDLLIIIPKQLT